MKRTEFVKMVQETVKGNTIITVECDTDAGLRKTGNPFGIVRKLQSLNGQIGFDYEDGVNRLAAKEGKEAREAKPRTWGHVTSNRLFVSMQPEGEPTHLRLRVFSCLSRRFVDANGQEIPAESIQPYLPPKRKTSTQADLEGEVVERDIKLENVKVVHMRGEAITLE